MNRRLGNYLNKALHDAKTQELVNDYRRNGFVVDNSTEMKKQGFDLVLRHKTLERVIVFEVKLLPLSEGALDKIEQLRQKAQALGYEFRLVTIAMPTRDTTKIDWFDREVLTYLRQTSIKIIEDKASHVAYQGVESDIQAISIFGSKAQVSAAGEIVVDLYDRLPTDSRNGDKAQTIDSFPFEGKFELDLAKETILHADIRVDDSEWFRG